MNGPLWCGIGKGVSQILLHLCLAKLGNYNLPLDSEFHIPKSFCWNILVCCQTALWACYVGFSYITFFTPCAKILVQGFSPGGLRSSVRLGLEAEGRNPCPSCSWQCPTQTIELPGTGERHELERKLLFWEMHLLRAPDKGKNYQDQAALRAKS